MPALALPCHDVLNGKNIKGTNGVGKRARAQGWNRSALRLEYRLTRSEVAAVGAIMHRFGMTFDPGPIRRPNPLTSSVMTPAERRDELCGLLALGLMRLKMKDEPEPANGTGEIRLHYPPDRCRHATPTHRRNA
jgi:hypothetical protein